MGAASSLGCHGVAYSPTYAGSDAFALVSFEGGSNSVNRIPTSVAVALRATGVRRATSVLRFPQGSGYKTRVCEYQTAAAGAVDLRSQSLVLRHILYIRTEEIACIGYCAHGVRTVRNARVFGAECCRWSVRDHARSRALFRPQTGRFTARTLGWNAEANSCETDCASRHAANLAARLF